MCMLKVTPILGTLVAGVSAASRRPLFDSAKRGEKRMRRSVGFRAEDRSEMLFAHAGMYSGAGGSALFQAGLSH